MSTQTIHISESINLLNKNLGDVARVGEWAGVMGYQNTKTFSRLFLRHYSVRTVKVMVSIRLKSIYNELRADEKSNFHIARRHSMPDEKALNMFVNYHLDCSPSQLRLMDKTKFQSELEKFCSEIR